MGCCQDKSADGFLDKYDVRKKLGEGAFGVVFEVIEREGQRTMAVKMVDKSCCKQAEIDREIDVISKLNHVNILRCHDVLSDNHFCYIVMDKYTGGDLVDGLLAHLQSKGKIAESNLIPIVRQMSLAMQYIHDEKHVVHRDVKGDNFLCDRPDICDPQCRIVLGDFGAAAWLEPGQYLEDQTGTTTFWAPEVIQPCKYTHNVDVWACGIVFFGLLDGTFPFRNTDQIVSKEMRIPKASPLAIDLLKGMLDKDHTKRLAAKDVLSHEWMKEESDERTQVELEVKLDGGLKEEVSEEVRKRREATIKRLEEEHAGRSARRDQRRSLVETNKSAEFKAEPFTSKGPGGEVNHFEWLEVEDAIKKGIDDPSAGVSGAEESVDLATESPETIRELLEKYGVDLKKFGVGKAMSLADFSRECVRGECLLLADDEQRTLTRVVDVVLLRMRPSTSHQQLLVEKSQNFADGRTIDRNWLPGAKRRPHENIRGTARRLLKESWQLQERDVEWIGVPDVIEEEEESQSYPGVRTCYRKHFLEGGIKTTSEATLKRLGAPNWEDFQISGQQDNVSSSTWTWLDEKECKSRGILKLGAKGGGSRFAGLKPATVECTAAGLRDRLQRHNVNIEEFCKAEGRSLEQLADEVSRGEASLLESEDRILLVVMVVALRLIEPEGKVLVETKVVPPNNGVIRQVNRLPCQKQRPHENMFHTARRLVLGTLSMKDDEVTFSSSKPMHSEEEHMAGGLKTVLRKTIVEARIGDLQYGEGEKASVKRTDATVVGGRSRAAGMRSQSEPTVSLSRPVADFGADLAAEKQVSHRLSMGGTENMGPIPERV